MSNKTRSILKGTAVVLVLLAIIMYKGWVVIPSLGIYSFWLVVIGFCLLFVSSK